MAEGMITNTKKKIIQPIFFSLNKTLSIKRVKITAAATIRKIAAGKTKPTINRKKVEIL